MKCIKPNIVKAEILFSRKCNLSCSYCKMVTGKENTLSVEDWKKGIFNLKELGCKFIAFYGAEPLLEFEKLNPVIKYTSEMGIDSTIITNGIVPNTREMLAELHGNGLRSLSMSYDPAPLDKHSDIKSTKALETLKWFKKQFSPRDVAAIATITSANYTKLPHMVMEMSKHGIWTFYDIYHYDRGQIGSKTAEINNIYAFHDWDIERVTYLLSEVNQMRKEGYLVHTNQHYMDILKKDPQILMKYNWNCADYDQFPSWITVDCDGTVYPCDDFQPKFYEPFNITKLAAEWEEFSCRTKLMVKTCCPGCFWNTHVGAHAIKAGIEDINDYVHGRE